MEMTDLRALAMGIYKFNQAMVQTDATCVEFVLASIGFAEASTAHDPNRKERMEEFYHIASTGVLTN